VTALSFFILQFTVYILPPSLTAYSNRGQRRNAQTKGTRHPRAILSVVIDFSVRVCCSASIQLPGLDVLMKAEDW
jgi:hypothetical protein